MTFIRLLMVLLVGLALWTPRAAAQETQPTVKIEKRQLLVPRKGDQPTTFAEDPKQWIREKQQSFYGAMNASLRQMNGGTAGLAAWTLLLLSFGYGVLHAAGPGHGKAVISAWLLATENELKRGVLVSFLSSIVQALAAIAIVSAVLFIFGAAVSATRTATGVLESASYALIGTLGLYLLWTAFRPLFAPRQHAHDHHDHSNCGHAHVPEARQVRENWSLAKACSMAFAVGLRPCSGAILVLLAAYPLGLYWAGIVSVFAMAAGTFLTVSVVAALTVYSKRLALRFAGSGGRAARWIDFGLRLTAGVLVTCLGGLLFWASLGPGATAG